LKTVSGPNNSKSPHHRFPVAYFRVKLPRGTLAWRVFPPLMKNSIVGSGRSYRQIGNPLRKTIVRIHTGRW
jgi:hypothetical protein